MSDLSTTIAEAELHLPYIGTGREAFAKLIEHAKSAVEPTEPNSLAVYFTPDAIVDAFDLNDEDDESKQFVENADEKTLREIGEACINSDVLWRTFHELIEDEVRVRTRA